MRSLVLLFWAAPLVAQDPPSVKALTPTGFLARTIAVAGTEHRYVVYVPPGYVATKPWPLLMFLNGMGECGTDGKRQAEVGLGSAIAKDPQRWPFVVVFPQKPDKPSQWSEHEALVMGTLAATEKEFRIDADRRFLTGLSQGGAGTWALGSKHASVWAAIAPVCGYGKPAGVVGGLKQMPIWAFHGLDDKTVPPQQSKDLCAAVEAAGGSPILTLYSKTAHNSWDQAYRESGLAEWFEIVVAEPVGARYLAEPTLLIEVKLEVTRVASGAKGEDRRPERTAMEASGATLRLVHDPGTGESKVTSNTVAAAVSHGEAPASNWQQTAAGARVHATLRALQRTGVFARLATRSTDAVAPGHRVDLALDGKFGPWRFHGFVPAAEPGGDSLRAAIDKVVEFVVAEMR